MSKPPAKKTQATKKRPPGQERSRPKNFTPEEDVLLTKAWLNVSPDNIKGTNQTMETVWTNIKTVFDELRADSNSKHMPNRDPLSLRNRWNRQIQHGCGKFLPYIRRVIREKPSGNNMDDKYKLAMEEYALSNEKTGPFKYLDCFLLLAEDHERWDIYGQPPDEEEIVVVDDDEVPDGEKKPAAVNKMDCVMASDFARPMGTKQAKKLAKQESSSSAQNQVAFKELKSVVDHFHSRQAGRDNKDKLNNLKFLIQMSYDHYKDANRRGATIEAKMWYDRWVSSSNQFVEALASSTGASAGTSSVSTAGVAPPVPSEVRADLAADNSPAGGLSEDASSRPPLASLFDEVGDV
jgi:hypothetical protein